MERADPTEPARRSAGTRPSEGDARSRLVIGGQRAFAEKGFARTRVDDIIRAAATSRATFYRYFDNKQALFSEISHACFEEMRGIARAIGSLTPGPDARAQLIELLGDWRALFERHGGVIRVWFEHDAMADSAISEQAAQVFDVILGELTGSIKAANSASKVEPDLQAALVFILIERSYYYVTSPLSRVNPDRLAPTLATMIERSFLGASAPPPGRRLRIANR